MKVYHMFNMCSIADCNTYPLQAAGLPINNVPGKHKSKTYLYPLLALGGVSLGETLF